jgi:hypothetical protein
VLICLLNDLYKLETYLLSIGKIKPWGDPTKNIVHQAGFTFFFFKSQSPTTKKFILFFDVSTTHPAEIIGDDDTFFV